jgi:hypothetical protein
MKIKTGKRVKSTIPKMGYTLELEWTHGNKELVTNDTHTFKKDSDDEVDLEIFLRWILNIKEGSVLLRSWSDIMSAAGIQHETNQAQSDRFIDFWESDETAEDMPCLLTDWNIYFYDVERNKYKCSIEKDDI